MSEFVLLFRTTEEARHQAMGTPERAERILRAWGSWLRDLDARGHLRHTGQALDPAGSVVRGKARLVTDGPFIETKDLVVGFLVVTARDLAQAVELARGCPMLDGDASVEIRPVASLEPARA